MLGCFAAKQTEKSKWRSEKTKQRNVASGGKHVPLVERRYRPQELRTRATIPQSINKSSSGRWAPNLDGALRVLDIPEDAVDFGRTALMDKG